MNAKVGLFAVTGLLVATGMTSRAEGPYGLYSRDGKITQEQSGEFWRINNRGRRDWAVNAPWTGCAVKPGEIYRLACSVGRIAKADGGVGQSVVLLDRSGQALSWSYGGMKLRAGRVNETSFAVPAGVARVYARIVGGGDAEFEVGRLKLEKTGTIPLAENLPERFELKTDALDIAVGSADFGLTVTDRRTGRTWKPMSGDGFPPAFVRAVEANGERVKIEATQVASLKPLTMTVALDPQASAEFTVTLAGEGGLSRAVPCPAPFVAEKGDWMVLPLSEGYRLPMREKTFRVGQPAMYNASLCMAFYGVEKETDGSGWMAIAETRNDAQVNVVYDKDELPVAVGPLWTPERGRFGYPRVVRYAFLDRGGYVAMAKRYRKVARAEGLLKTFREKAKARPLVDRLLGAPNVWYFGRKNEPAATAMAQELKAAGIDRFLWSANAPAEDVKALAKMPDVLVGRYDCYRDIYTPQLVKELGWTASPNDEICRNTSAWPDDVIWNSADSNDVRRAWGVTCKDGKKRHCAAQCTLCKPKRVRANVTRELKTKPFNTRFIDVTMAIGAEECENPAHPMTRTQSRAAACEMLRLLGDDFGLVVGSEQGIDFAVPVCDYFEGMLAPWPCRMPHGRKGAQWTDIFREGLNPTNVTPAEFSKVVDYHLGERYRVPLFELVYHDCCCAHWYWYDYSNRPICLWPKRDLLTVLYGTAPMYVFDYRLWTERKEMFVESYRRTCPVARRTGYSEMTDHRALTPDRRVQRSTFADGTVVTVNFGDRPYALEDGAVLAPHAHKAAFGNP